jgi:SAM-dependent methyltransferase
MTTTSGSEDEVEIDPELAGIVARLESLRSLVQSVSDEVGPGKLLGAESVIERRRPEVYVAMDAVGLAAHEFVQKRPPAERLAAATDLVIEKLREISLTSPITFYAAQRKRSRLTYFELVSHVRERKAAGADVPTRVLDDYYVHTKIGEGFFNRLNMLARRLTDQAARCLSLADHHLHLLSLQYIGGEELLPLARFAALAPGVQATCLDDSVAAVRDAEQRLKPAFGSRVQCMMADPVNWLHGPACATGSICIAYAASLVEQLPVKRAVRLLEGIYRVLRPGGVFLMGCTPGKPPIGEQMIRDWLLGWDWQYRSEGEWRELFASTPFTADNITFEYEPLGINALVRLEKPGERPQETGD